MRVAGLFSGIGGFELGLSRTGHTTELLCESDPGARAVLARRFDMPVHRDVRTLKALPRSTEIVTAGFPCQDLSQVGTRGGLRGKESGLISELWRLLERRSTAWVVLENVPFMLHLGRGEAISKIVKRFERLGYKWAYRVVDSQAFGLAQRRRRLFVIAAKSGDPRNVLLADEANSPASGRVAARKPCGFYWTEGNSGLGWAVDSIPPLKGGSAIGIPSPPAVFVPPCNFVLPSISDAEKLQGFPRGWTKPAAETCVDSSRWRLVGNAVSVPVAEWLGRRLGQPGVYDASEDQELNPGSAWPNAAWGDGKRRFESTVSDWPVHRRRSSILSFLKEPNRPLSYKAGSGFLSRLENSTLHVNGEFMRGLRCYLGRIAPLVP